MTRLACTGHKLHVAVTNALKDGSRLHQAVDVYMRKHVFLCVLIDNTGIILVQLLTNIAK